MVSAKIDSFHDVLKAINMPPTFGRMHQMQSKCIQMQSHQAWEGQDATG